jgi:hypothetical protein
VDRLVSGGQACVRLSGGVPTLGTAGIELYVVLGFVLLNPTTVLLATSLRAELLFTAMLIGVFL